VYYDNVELLADDSISDLHELELPSRDNSIDLQAASDYLLKNIE